MSTLTSAQLCVKRSSTRLHAPPGGHSSLSFGPGGFGTVDGGEKGEANPAEQLPPSRGGYSSSGTSSSSSSGGSNYYAVGLQPPATSSGFPPSSYGGGSNYYSTSSQPPPTSGGYGGGYGGGNTYSSYSSSAQPPPTSGGYGASSNFYAGNAQAPPPTSSGYSSSNGYTPGGNGYTPMASGFGAPPGPSQPPVACASARWSAQPPLTSSKRDQNWEKKRRLWLAHRASGSGSADLPPPPSASSCGWGEAPPASPLSKFIQQNASRLPTAPSSASSDHLALGVNGFAPSTPLTGAADSARYGLVTASSRSSGSSDGRAAAPGTRAGSRQPPGGRTQWSPFS